MIVGSYYSVEKGRKEKHPGTIIPKKSEAQGRDGKHGKDWCERGRRRQPVVQRGSWGGGEKHL